jgi:hypothetical protein
MKAFQLLNVALSFFLELAMLAAFGFWALSLEAGLLVRIVAAIIAVAAASVLWGFVAAPKAARRLKQPYLSLFILAMFGLAALALLAAGHAKLAGYFAGIAILNVALAYAWNQDK